MSTDKGPTPLVHGEGREQRELGESSGSAAEGTSPDRTAFAELYTPRLDEGPLVVAGIPIGGDAPRCRAFTEIEAAADHMAALSRNHDVYVVNNPVGADWQPDDKGSPPSDADIVARHRFQLDFDPKDEHTTPEQVRAEVETILPGFLAEAREAVDQLPDDARPPGEAVVTSFVLSGRGVHLHLDFHSHVLANEKTAAINQAIIEWWRQRVTCCKPDGVANPCRLMRAVGSVNHRTGTVVRALRHDPEARSSFQLWRTVFGESGQHESSTAPAQPGTVHPTIDRRFDDKLRRYAGQLTDAKRQLLEQLAALEWDDIDKNATPESAGLDRSAAMEAAAGQMLRENVAIPTIAGILANPNLAISAHVYDNEKHKSASARCRAVVRAIAEAVLSQEEPEDHRPVLGGSPMEAARTFRDRVWPTLIHQRQDYLAYDAGAYREIEEETVRAKLYHFLEGCDQLDKKGNARPCVPTSQQVSMILDALRAVAHVPAERYEPPCFLDGRTEPDPRELVSFPNGLLHLPSGELLPPTPQFFTRNALSFDYDADAPEPTAWLRFLKELWPDDDEQDCIDALQDFMGYAITLDTSMQKSLLIVGRKRSGKGTAGRVLTELVGRHNTTSPTLNSLSRDFGLEPLMGKQLAIISDMRLGAKTDPATVAENLLRITGEDSVTINRKYKAAITTTLPVRFVALTNLLPKFSDTSGALASRFIVLPTQQSFYGREDRNLTRKLLAELPGILNWAIEGWRRVQARGYLTEPKVGREAIEHMVDLATPIPAFVRECCRVGPDATVDKGKLFRAFRTWHFERYGTDARYSSKEWFSRDLYAAVDGVRGARTNTGDRLYTGIELIGEPPVNHEDLF